MNPLSALIGAGASIFGGLMNTSSTQAINAANLQNQMWSAQGGYLPGLVDNANKAGLNPLAVLGSRGPNMAVQVGEQPGAGLQQAAGNIAKMDTESYENQLQLQREQIAQLAAVNKNTMIDNAKKIWLLDQIQSGKLIPAEASQPARETSLQGMGIDWMRGKSLGDIFGGPSYPVNGPTSWSDRALKSIQTWPSWY